MSANPRICFNCGERATTKEHVIPNGLYPKSSNARRITIPACRSCNNGISQDEEYFRTILATMQWAPSPAVEEVLTQRVVPSFREDNTKLRRGLLGAMESILVETDRGLVETGRIQIDAARMDKVAEKIVRGLYYHLRHEPMSESISFSHYWMPREPLAEEALQGGLISVDPEVFSCRYRVTSGHPHASLWWLLFYRNVLHVVSAVEPTASSTMGL